MTAVLKSQFFREILLSCAIGCVLALAFCAPVASASTQSARSNATAGAAVASSRKAALIDTGRLVFNQRCEICHFVDSGAQKIGPGLKGLFARTRFASGAKITDASVAAVIDDGGKNMPGYQDLLKPGQLQALIAYLKSH